MKDVVKVLVILGVFITAGIIQNLGHQTLGGLVALVGLGLFIKEMVEISHRVHLEEKIKELKKELREELDEAFKKLNK